MADTTLENRLLVLDHEPWYDAPGDYSELARQALQQFAPHILGPAELRRLTTELTDETLQPGDVVVAPLMSGALLLPTLADRCAEMELPLLLLPMSKHPFVTLSADDPTDLMTYCGAYARSSEALPSLPGLLGRLVGEGRNRVVFIDSNTATGRDALLFRELCRQWIGDALDFCFSVLVNEVGDDDSTAPGWRHGAKAMAPDTYAVRLRRRNTRYLSHLRFLSQGWEAQTQVARSVRGTFPALTTYWDTVPDNLAHIHGHRTSTLPIHTERLHVRFSPDEDGEVGRAVGVAVHDLDEAAPLLLTGPATGRRDDAISSWLAIAGAGLLARGRR